MCRFRASLAFALFAGACSTEPDLTDVTGARGIREVVGSTFGGVLPGASEEELIQYVADRNQFFLSNFTPDMGLGPVMTSNACGGCHDTAPTIGGTNQRLETRFGVRNPDGTFDPLLSAGGPVVQDEAIGTMNGYSWVPETVPAAANVVAQRRTTPLFGLGLVDATPDSTFAAVAEWQRGHHPEAAGRAAKVRDRVANADAVGKFGWKASQPTLLLFAADALLNEMGITTPIFPDENCPQGDCAALAHNPAPGVNDPDGIALAGIFNFMTLLGPPPRRENPSPRGAQLFRDIGCAICHQPTLVTGPSASRMFDRVAYHPFSDFLLHDMGALGDGIDQGDAKGPEMRTAPLWGLLLQRRLLHDGRARSITDAILAHDGQGKAARDDFAALQAPERDDLLLFLKSL